MRSSILNSFGCAIAIHAITIGLTIFTAEERPKPSPKLIVQTVMLKPSQQRQSPAIRAPKLTAPPKQAPVKKPETPQPQANPVPEPSAPQPEASSEPIKEMSTAKPSAKKESPTSKPTVSSKSKTATTKKSAPQKTQPNTSTTAKATNKQTQSTQPQKPVYNQHLVTEALERLNNMKSSTSSAKSGSYQPSMSTTAPVGTLHSDAASFGGENDGEDMPLEGSPEAIYIHDFIRRIQLHMQLPESGSAKVRLVLQRSGHVSSVEILTCKNASIRKMINEHLHTIVFSAFGSSFPGESSHTFIVRLSNDFMWSCS